MVRKTFLLVLLLCSFVLPAFCQQDSTPHLRISLLTCGPGDEEVYEVFGHTGVRVIDSVHHTDLVYGYGTFSYGPDFELQFMKGKLLYYISAMPFQSFMEEYIEAKRSVEEQELIVDWKAKEQIAYFLEWNMEPENKYYKYDFFFDNCATRIRDIFTSAQVFGRKLHYGRVIPEDKKISYRDIMNRYFYRDHWTRMGVNLLLGSKIDKAMSNEQIMFLPDYLRDGLAGATVDGKKIAAPPALILPTAAGKTAGFNEALLVSVVVLLLTIAGFAINSLRLLGKIMSVTLLIVSGLLGILVLVMWFGTDHQGCSYNLNILWLLPTNLVIAFFKPKGKTKYALIGMMLILLSFVLHIAGIQKLVLEFVPIQLSLLYVMGMIYRKGNNQKTANAGN